VTITVTPSLEPIGQLLTPEEYDALPENHLRELVDGVIHMMAAPTSWHQIVKDALRAGLRAAKPTDLIVLGEVEVRLRADLRRIPDVVIVRRQAYARDRNQYLPAEVVLAVEVVSPGTESTDWILKPIEYAHAGIGHFWRIEIDPEIEVVTYRLGDDKTYGRTGTFRAGEKIVASGLSWARIDVDALADED
jgi:Uma2 family endonuclease